MQTCDYKKMESYMLSCMQDSAHDSQHIYRVLYIALDIASHEEGVDFDVLIAACLLHDIGRQEEFRDPALCHAAVGAAKAYAFLTTEGWFPAAFAQRVAGCIRAHRFRSGSPPARIEEKILFDADKLDVTGCTGIARSLLYIGQVGTPLYSLDAAGAVSDGSRDEQPSFSKNTITSSKGSIPCFIQSGAGNWPGSGNQRRILFTGRCSRKSLPPTSLARRICCAFCNKILLRSILQSHFERSPANKSQ